MTLTHLLNKIANNQVINKGRRPVYYLVMIKVVNKNGKQLYDFDISKVVNKRP
jgi:hypothetical protein